MYNVVTKNRTGDYKDVITWTSFEDEDKFKIWFDDKMQEAYEIVAEGISTDECTAMCSTTEANLAAQLANYREFATNINNLLKSVEDELDGSEEDQS